MSMQDDPLDVFPSFHVPQAIQPNYPQPRPMPDFRRMMIFIDGENLVFNYQKEVNNGRTPNSQDHYIEDVFVWRPRITDRMGLHEIIRATYYTYAVGSEQRLEEIKNTIRSSGFETHRDSHLPYTLTPVVFKKPKQAAKAKGVDIQLTVDILTHVYNDNVDTVVLLSGDGDYMPVIEEVVRYGKQIWIGAFKFGLNRNLIHIADVFVLLDQFFFIPEQN